MAGHKPRYWAKRPFGYDGVDLDRGQVFEFHGLRNDEKLLALNFVGEVAAKAETYTCGVCGADFIGMAERNAHGSLHHRETPLTPLEEDQRAERQERMLTEVAPVGRGLTV